MSRTNQCLIASYRGDFVWLQHCLRSLQRFSVGFLPPVVAVSYRDLELARSIVQQTYPEARVFVYDVPPPWKEETPGFGMMRAMAAMLHGDLLCPEADNIFLVGSDCIATRPFDATDYLDNFERPIVLYNSYEKLREVHPDAIPWRNGTAQILGFTPPHEYMRRLPSVFCGPVFSAFRRYVEELHGQPFLQYWYSTYAAGQRGQSEANLLGALAFSRPHVGYHKFVNLDLAPPGEFSDNALLQMWSHGGLDRPIDTHYLLPSGDVFGRTPRSVIEEVLGPFQYQA